MKVSELLDKLEEAQKEYGDQELVVDDSVPYSTEPAYALVDNVKFNKVQVKRYMALTNLSKGEYLEIVL